MVTVSQAGVVNHRIIGTSSPLSIPMTAIIHNHPLEPMANDNLNDGQSRFLMLLQGLTVNPNLATSQGLSTELGS